ncbi:uncharacterized protein LOC143297223 [Babylonia areolata]|uniref:uncharacterized protein LOC143297223 n=1 Tax=Babylonia areolata TaxID=304850 RepID=UPI003FCF4786
MCPTKARMSRAATHRSVSESMLICTQRMREIAQFRQESALVPPTARGCHVMSCQAPLLKGVRVFRKVPHPLPSRQCPLSLDGLSDKRTMKESNAVIPKKKNQRFSVADNVFPPAGTLVPVQAKKQTQIHTSFVSASDLFELVSFSLRSKTSREESMKHARYEESLNLMKESDFLETFSPRQTVKAVGEKEYEVKETLVVYGVSSSRDIRKGHRTNGSKSKGKGEISQNSPSHSHDMSKETLSQLEQKKLHSLGLLREKHLIMLHTPKLRHRPNRAKRMTLHRSLLSVIPEDERRRQEEANEQAQDAPFTRKPVIPTSSSLTVIRSTRNEGTVRSRFIITNTPNSCWDTDDGQSDDNSPSSSAQDINNEVFASRKPSRTSPAMHTSEVHKPVNETASKTQSNPPDDKPSHLHKGNGPRRNSTNNRLSSWHSNRAAMPLISKSRAQAPSGRPIVLCTPGRTRAQKKFKNLVFLRDTAHPTH